MQSPKAHGTDTERGQASVELLGSLPAALLAIAVAWQLVLSGHACWSVSNAARVAARAAAVNRDPKAAARSALPSYLEHGLRVKREGDSVSVRVHVPLLMGSIKTPLTLGASAAMKHQR